ncbi:uncharacterized protein LOC131668359 isoform X2 [Phymastichus coffea]|nr:uncharacterized protein LOC131668359 isoform X2 [Phymastichus coffea]
MTDITQNTSKFSFRTFDIYRRFIEVLQHKPTYLEEFKIGSPTEETCLAVIKKVFQSQQEKEEIKEYTQYFAIHAKMMAGHAEKLPDNWNDAINYTDRYIKEIRKYLRRKGLSVKSDLNKVKKIANDIAKYIHNKPTFKQIEAITYYLKYDLRNPKRNLISLHAPKISKSKSDSISKNIVKSKIINNKVVEEEKATFVQEKNDQSSSAHESMQKAPHFLQINNQVDYNNYEVMKPSLQLENIETEIIENLFEMIDPSISNHKIDNKNDLDIFNYERNVMSPELSPFNNIISYGMGIENNFKAEKDEISGGVSQTFRTNIVNCSSTNFNTVNKDRSSNYNFHLKRKYCSPFKSDHYYGLKKQLQLCKIPNNFPQKAIITPSQAVKNNNDNSSDSEINIENDNKDKEPSKFFMMNQYEKLDDSEGKTVFDSEISEQIRNIFGFKSKVRDMSYTDALKHIDLVTTFCKLKSTISQQELLIMHQIRDKMYFKSLNE